MLQDHVYNKINVPGCRMRIAMALGVTEQTIILAIRKKSKTLTQYNAVKVIMDFTGLKEEELMKKHTTVE